MGKKTGGKVNVDKKDEKMIKVTPLVSWFLKCQKFWNSSKLHHLVAEERGGKNENANIKKIDGYHHWLFHELFDLMTPEEAQIFLGLWLRGQKKTWKDEDIFHLRGLIIDGKMEEALNFSQFNYKSGTLAQKFMYIIEKKMKKTSFRLIKKEKTLRHDFLQEVSNDK